MKISQLLCQLVQYQLLSLLSRSWLMSKWFPKLQWMIQREVSLMWQLLFSLLPTHNLLVSCWKSLSSSFGSLAEYSLAFSIDETIKMLNENSSKLNVYFGNQTTLFLPNSKTKKLWSIFHRFTLNWMSLLNFTIRRLFLLLGPWKHVISVRR